MSYSQKERDLIDILEQELGYAAMRAPASGGATDRELPDVIAGREVHPPRKLNHNSTVWHFEVKYRSKPTYYFDREDV